MKKGSIVAGILRTAFLLILFLAGCTILKPSVDLGQPWTVPSTFSHEDFDGVLQRFVDQRGLVNYAALKNQPEALERYLFLLSKVSPDSHPDLFPSEEAKLAYWINAYNATSIGMVLSHYPISSVLDVKTPFPFFFLPETAGFFVFQRMTYGDRTTSLYFLENGLIRKRFADPRVHFALNCSSLGCPRLLRQAFAAKSLAAKLDGAAREFLAEERNFKIDRQQQVVFLSEIFDWYEKDFLNWYQKRYPDERADLLKYVELFLPQAQANELRMSAASYKLRFIPFDWRLNDRSGPDQEPPQ